MDRRRAIGILAGGTAAIGMMAGLAAAEVSGDVIRIGVLTDMSSLYSDSTGQGSVFAAEMAVAETGMGRVEDKILKNVAQARQTPGVDDP